MLGSSRLIAVKTFQRRHHIVGKRLCLSAVSRKGCFIEKNFGMSIGHVVCTDKSKKKLLCVPGLFKASQSVSFIFHHKHYGRDDYYILRHLGVFGRAIAVVIFCVFQCSIAFGKS